MNFRETLGTQLLFFDGAMGTMLQAAGLLPGMLPDVWSVTHKEVVMDIHRAYLNAGCNILLTNTFGCTAHKLASSSLTPEEVATAATACAKETVLELQDGTPRFVALDVGPIGRLLRPLGDLCFEDAVSMFAASMQAGAQAGADLVLIETMSDLYELKAAVLAAKEHTQLPICACVTLDQNGKLLTGGDVASIVALLEGLRVDAIGLNCGLGPTQMLPFLKEMQALSSLPLIMMPNAGLPIKENGSTVYNVRPAEFASAMQNAIPYGAQILGGCCGTSPAHMQALIAACKGKAPSPVVKKTRTVVASYGRAVAFGESPVLIGERINPTGKPRLKEALKRGDYGYILREGITQVEHGAAVLDVNAGLPGIDEAAVLTSIVEQLQSVTDAPLQLDTANPAALARALRVYNGKALINSVNGKAEVMDAVFPLVARYGGVVVALTLDENGIPETAEARVSIASRIIARAAAYGIDKKDILVDALTMTISAGENHALVTLETLRLLREQLGVHTILGVSNVSFGLPGREKLNAAFFTLAIHAGLSAAILNPHAEAMTDAYYSACALCNKDPQCARFIARNSGQAQQQSAPSADMPLEQAVRLGLSQQAKDAAAAAALQAKDALGVINEQLVPALDFVGDAFEKGTLFLPQLLMTAEAAKAAFEVIRAHMGTAFSKPKGLVVIATVQGDVHDIGKNIVKALLENYQFQVIDLGKDVPPKEVLAAAKAHDAKLVGLSALMTTTVESMRNTIALLRAHLPACKIMVGGAVLTQAYADSIGADFFAKDAMASVHYAQKTALQEA